MNQIDNVFTNRKRKALIPYVTIGYPDINTTKKIVPELTKIGCDIIELGIPFSDPLADGATIQNASFLALQNGITVRKCLDLAQHVSKLTTTPLVFMTYLNPIISYGFTRFCLDCADCGISGLIISDLPPEEGTEIEDAAHSCNIHIIYLLAPTSTENRIKIVCSHSQGFIYLTSVSGVTGTRQTLSDSLESFVKRIRKETDKPICVGFGISTAEQAAHVASITDGVIIGSKLIQLLEQDPSMHSVQLFISQVRRALNGQI